MECPNCNGLVVSPDGQNGEQVCSTCGLVFPRTSTIKENSFMQWNPKWHSNWQDNDSETLKEWLTILRTVSCQLNLPNFPYREEAARRIRKENCKFFQSQKFGKNKRATIAALLHQILRQYNKNRPLKDICKQLGLDSRLVTKQAWNLNKTIIETKEEIKIPRRTSTDCLFDYGRKLPIDATLLAEANGILMRLRRPGGNPVALASGALYHVCKNKKLKVSKEQIAEAFKISHRTVYMNEVRIRTILKCIDIQKPPTTQTPLRMQIVTIQQRK